MNRLRELVSLPILAKDLIEQSARRRLFVMRVIYTLLMIGAAAAFALPILSEVQSAGIGMLGNGRRIFSILIALEFVGIYLFLPGLTCGVITVEKERNTLGLLFLTKLRPWTIIFEKVGSRLILMFNLLLTSLPLLAFTYSLGGFEAFDLFCGLWCLALSSIMVTCLAVFASCYFRTTVAAFLATYALLAGFNLGPALLDITILRGSIHESYTFIGQKFLNWLLGVNSHLLGDYALVACSPPAIFIGLTHSSIPQSGAAYVLMVLAGLPTLIISAFALWVGKMCLVPRAFLPAANPLLRFFKALDFLFNTANERFTRGIILVKEASTMPGDRPIEWRETAKRSLGQIRYLIRVLVVLEIPTLYFVLQGAGGNPQIKGTETVLWIIVALIIATMGSTLITGERARQSLDVLLSTPLTGRQIILEKMSSVRRMMLVCAIPLLTCLVFQTAWRIDRTRYINYSNAGSILQQSDGWRSAPYIWHEYFLSGLVTIFVYLQLLSWLTLWLGIRSKSPSRAILICLGTLIAWCVVPPFVLALTSQHLFYRVMVSADYNYLRMLFFSSPVAFLALNESDSLWEVYPIPYIPLLVNTALYGACWLWIRRDVLNRADEYLGRGRRVKPLPPAAVLPPPSSETVSA